MSEIQPDPQNTTIAGTGASARATDTLLRAVGGRAVMLRIPAPAVAADPSEQLGLATPGFQDLPMAPAVFRKARAAASTDKPVRWEMLVSATAVVQMTSSQAYGSAAELFASALGVLCDDELFAIVSATEEQAFGQPYVFRLVLRTAERQTV